jgi:hypothetical protein
MPLETYIHTRDKDKKSVINRERRLGQKELIPQISE